MDNFLSEVKHSLADLSSFSRVHIVIGNESCDLDSAVAAVTYAFYLHTKNEREATPDVSSRETILTVPVLNILESQFRLRTETTHFFKNCNIQASNLIFKDCIYNKEYPYSLNGVLLPTLNIESLSCHSANICPELAKDQIDLKSLYDENRLVLTLVDHNVLTGDYSGYEDCVIEVIDHRPKERADDDRVRVKLDLVGSCCTLVAEELLDDPDFHLDETIAKLLYGTILVDTINRSPDAGKITQRDENILLCLEKVLPYLEGDKLFNELQAAKFDICGLLNMEILEKDLKRLAGTAMTIAMSSVTMDMQELILRPNFKEDLDKFCVQENCEVVVIMTLVNDDDGKPTRQIAVYSQNRIFRDQIADTMDNSEDIDLDLELVTPPFEEISVFQQGNVKASRKKVLPILKSFLVGDTTPDIASKDFVSVHTVSVPTDGFMSVVVPETPEVHFTLESIEEMSGRSSFEENADANDVDLFDSDKHFSNKNILDFDPLATISSLDEESPSKDIPDDTLLGNSQNPFGDLGDTNSNKLTQNAREPSANFSSANLSSAHSSNVFDLGISDSELVDPFSSIEETVNQVSLDTNPKEIKDGESGENETKDEDNNPFNIEVPIENGSGVENAHSSNPFQDIVESEDGDVSNAFVNFQLSDCDDEDESKDFFSKGDNSDYTGTSTTNPFSSGIFLEVDAYKSEHLLSYKSPSLIVECDDKSQADDLADLEESELFDKIPTPEIERSGESSPFVMSGTGTPYEPQCEYHSRTGSESGSGTQGMVVPPNSLMDQGFDDMDRRLPSFNNAEMVEKINLKKALLGDLVSMEESAEENADVSVPYTPANSFRDNSLENIMRENSLPNLLNDSEMLEKVQQKRNSLQANFDFTELSDTQSNPFESNPFRSSTFEENSSSLGTTLTSNDNPFFQLDGNTSDGMFGNQSEGVTSLDKYDTSDVFNLFGDTGESTNTSLDNQVGSKTGSMDFFDNSDFVTQSTQSGQSFNPFINDTFSSYDSASIPTNQTVDKSFDSTCDIDQDNSANQSIIEVMNNSANLEAAGAVSESVAKEIIHNAIETFPDLKNPAVAEGVFSNAEQDGIPFWTQQGSGDSGIGSTDSPQQAPKVKLQTHAQNSEVSVETEYLPGMDPLHGSQNIVTSPLQSHSVETDADKEVVEGESFRKVSEAFLPEHSSFLLNHTSTTQPELPEQIREMIINKNIDTTADNIQSSTSVNKVVSFDEDTVISLDKKDTDLSDLSAVADVPLMAIPKDKEPLINTADENANSLDISEESSKTEISNGVLDDAKHEVPVADLIGDFLESGPVDKEVVDSQEHANDSSIDVDNDIIYVNEDSDKDLMNENVVSTIDVDNDIIHVNEDSNKDLMNENVVSTSDVDNDIIHVNEDSDKDLMNENVVSTSGSDNSISSDASSSFQSTSESELITVRENTEKPSVVTNTMLMEHLEDNSDGVETSTHVDTESLENRVSYDMNEDLMSKEDEINYTEVADQLVKDTFTQVFEQEKARIIKGEKAVAAVYDHGEEILEENLDTSDNTGIDMPESCNELSNVDKQFVVDKSDVVAEKTPVLINSFMTESALTIESISPAETPLEEHASGFYEVNPEDRHENKDHVGLNESCYQTNLGENETGFYEFYNDAEENQEDMGSNKEHVGMNIRSYVDNALKLDSVINNDNTNLLMLNDDYSDASVSPLETPETEHAKGFYDLNADNLEPLNVSSSLMADSTYSDSSMSPLDTPNTETVGGFYEFNTDVADKSEENVATQKQLGPDDAPEINIELVDSPESSKDSFDSETESCFEETGETKQEGIISKSNDDENNVTTKNRSVRFADSTKFPEELVKSTETVESQESDNEGLYELNAELEGDLLQNIDVGNPFSPIESPNEDVFALDYEINPCVPDLTIQSSDEECNDNISEKSGVKFLNDDDVEKEHEKLEEMADFLVEVALNEAISALHDEHSESIEIHQNEVSSPDNISDTENNVDDIAEEEPCDKKYEEGLFDVADQLVEEAMSSAIEIIQDMNTDSETFRDPVTGDSCRLFSDSSDSETSSTTTEGSYRIDHSSEVATPDRDGIAAADINVTSTVDDFNNDEQKIDENLSGLSDANFSEEITGDRTIQVEDAENVELQTENVEQFMEENKENGNVEPETNLEVGEEKAEFKSSFGDANEENTDNDVSHNLNDENGNVTDDIHEHDISAEFDLDEEDTNTSRFDEDTNTSMDVKSPDGPTYYKYDSFELDDKDVTEKSKTLNRQGTIIPDIVISMDDSAPVVDDTVKCRRLGNYKPEIIDLSHETEDEVSEKDDSFESDNVSETSVDTKLMTEETVEVLSSDVEGVNAKKELSNVNCEDIDKHVEDTMELASRILNDSNKDSDNDNKDPKNNLENSNTDSVKYHNIKDLESEKQAKKGEKSKKVRENSSESTVIDKKDLGHEEYVTRKEIFYTSAGRLSVSIDSVVDHPSESESETDATLQKKQKPVDDDDDLTTEPTDQIDQQNDEQKSPLMSQEKMKVMEETQEWHEDPIPGMGVTQESSTDESDTESESEYTKPARPDTLLNGARKKKKISATNNLLTPDSTDDLVEGVDNIPTPDDLETPSDLDGELEWEDDTPITPASDSKKFVEYRDDEAEREKYENTKFRKVEIAGKDYRVDMKVIEPYKKVLSHGGYYGDGLNAIILFCGCYLPDRGRRDYQYVMDNLFLYVISTLELLVAEDYMIVYFHGATPRRQMPSFSWLKRCYQMIDRRLRKNLKGLLMVHPTLWLKTVVLMTKPFISSKFSSKLRFVKTLKELGKIVPMEYIYVPEPVSQYDAKLYQHRPCTSTPVTPSSSS